MLYWQITATFCISIFQWVVCYNVISSDTLSVRRFDSTVVCVPVFLCDILSSKSISIYHFFLQLISIGRIFLGYTHASKHMFNSSHRRGLLRAVAYKESSNIWKTRFLFHNFAYIYIYILIIVPCVWNKGIQH